MSNGKAKPAKGAEPAAPAPAGREAKGAKPAKTGKVVAARSAAPPAPPLTPPPPLFRKLDWYTFGITAVILFVVYMATLSPDLTLEDSGELAVGSFYAGVPHAPGYPVWTVYSWLFTVLLPFSNIAWRVSVSSAVAASLASGLLGLLVSRGCSMILEGIEEFKNLDRRWESALCMVSGFVAALMIGLNGFMWSQAVIVEVYCLSVLSLMGVLCCLLRWMYAPEQRRYLYWAAFLYGISFNNHQTLIVAAMGLEVAIAAARPSLGRDALFCNVLIYGGGLILKNMEVLTSFDNNLPLYVIYNTVGLGSLACCGWLTLQTQRLGTEWRTVGSVLVAWIIGAAFYFYMPLTSMTNPPMNWAYPRTWDGFIHAFSRGQYEATHPTNILTDPLRFLMQLKMYVEGAIDEFHVSFLLLAVVPYFFYSRMQKRERAWILGNTAIYLCLAVLLLILLNPTTDRQSRDLTKVFFTASHVTISMFLGFGLALVGAMLLSQYERWRAWVLYGTAVLIALAVYTLVVRIYEVYGGAGPGGQGLGVLFHGLHEMVAQFSATQPILTIYAGLFVVGLIAAFLSMLLVCRTRVHMPILLTVFGLIPVSSLVGHWADNEQHGHLFGFWFGHDMLTPPFGIYPEMARNAVLYGGTDPGRFCPTYMIFCESFIPPQDRRDPKFDRRDVYIITQNALADNTYLEYIRAHYNRSTQIDPPFLRDMVLFCQNMAMGQEELKRKANGEFHHTNVVAKFIGSLTNVVAPIDKLLLSFGAQVEQRRRREGVYPRREIHTSSVADSQRAFQEYINDAQRRLNHDTQFPNEPKQIRPGEMVSFTPDGRVQVAGQVAVMAINGLLTKDIFDRNPTNEFYVEESFPLEWMYPHLAPYGIIMKIERQPVPEFTDEILQKDHKFWSLYSARLCGNWITYDTPVQDLCDFVRRIYLRGDLRGYKGDPGFVRDNDAQKAFSKLRNSIAGLYAWRFGDTKNMAERARVYREADFAFKQAFVLCPYSPETVTRYVTLLANSGRVDDALAIAETCREFDEDNPFTVNLIEQIRAMKQGLANATQVQSQLSQLERAYRTNTNNIQAAFNLAGAYLQLQHTGEAFTLLDQLVARPNVDAGTLLSVANGYVQLGQYRRVEPALRKLTVVAPNNPEVWYDLAGAEVVLGKPGEAVQSLQRSLTLSDQRLALNPKASNLHVMAANDPRFTALRPMPEFQQLFKPR